MELLNLTSMCSFSISNGSSNRKSLCLLSGWVSTTQYSLICKRAAPKNPTDLHATNGMFCSHNKFDNLIRDFSPSPQATTTEKFWKNSGLLLIMVSTFSSMASPLTSGLSSWRYWAQCLERDCPNDDGSRKKLKEMV